MAAIDQCDGQEVLWTAAKRLGSTWRWLNTDLLIHGCLESHRDVVQQYAGLLKLIGSKLLPGLGQPPKVALASARAGVLDLVHILSQVATRN